MSKNNSHFSSSFSVGLLLAQFRSRKGLTINGLAEGSGLSHTYLRAIESGESTLSCEKLDKIAFTLRLSDDDRERLKLAVRDQDALVAPGFIVSAKVLQERESNPDVQEIWVAERNPIEIHQSEWLSTVTSNIHSDKLYVYFLTDDNVKTKLFDSLQSVATKKQVKYSVTFIKVKEILQPFFFNPEFALYLQKGSHRVVGVWGFQGPYSHSIDCGCAMEQSATDELYRSLRGIVDQSRASREGLDNSLFTVFRSD